MKSYVLESVEEFERLEKQSQNKAYNFESELKNFSTKKTGTILDAGCGSGIVSRYLANQYPHSKVIGCDSSKQRISQATQYIQSHKNAQRNNLSFEYQELTQLTFDTASIDSVVCRYVLEHMSNVDALQALKEFYRCMRPNGKLCIIDFDGLIFNLFPSTDFLNQSFLKIQKLENLDLNIGRKLPHLVAEAGFNNMKWWIETFQFQDDELKVETQLIQERFLQAMPVLISAFGSEQKAHQFIDEYFACLKKPGAVLFYNKFIIIAEKSGLKLQK